MRPARSARSEPSTLRQSLIWEPMGTIRLHSRASGHRQMAIRPKTPPILLTLASPEKLQEQASPMIGSPDTARLGAESAPMIARTAELKVVVEKFDHARKEVDRILAQYKGYIAHLSASAENDSARILIASLRVPADQLGACIAELKQLGRVTQESQAGVEVTREHQDLIARLKNSRNTEARLDDVLRQRNGKIADVLDLEREAARGRGE